MYAQQEKKKGIQIRSLLAYIQSGLKSGLGKGLSLTQTKKEREAEEKKRIDQEHAEILKWQTREFPTYLSTYYERIGSEATDAEKFAFIDIIKEQIANTPSLKPIYYDNKDKIKQQQMRLSLGMELVKESGKSETDLFIDWVADTRNKAIEFVNEKWRFVTESPF